MILTFVALALLTLALTPLIGAVRAPLVEDIRDYRGKTRELRADKCLPTLQVGQRRVALIPRGLRPYVREFWRHKLLQSMKAGRHHCLERLSPAGIIRHVFPEATEDAAISVADCESHLYPYARNPSGASGLFQLMPRHWRGRFDPFDPWANTRYAYRLSDRGYNWSAWVCRP